MPPKEKEASVHKSSVNDLGEHHFSNNKYEEQKYDTNLTTLSTGDAATAKTTGFMKRVIGGNNGIWHEWDKTYQYILVIYADRMMFDTLN